MKVKVGDDHLEDISSRSIVSISICETKRMYHTCNFFFNFISGCYNVNKKIIVESHHK